MVSIVRVNALTGLSDCGDCRTGLLKAMRTVGTPSRTAARASIATSIGLAAGPRARSRTRPTRRLGA